MQYKCWVVAHRSALLQNDYESAVSDTEDDEMEIDDREEIFEDEEEIEEGSGLQEWLKEWEKKERVYDKVRRRIAKG